MEKRKTSYCMGLAIAIVVSLLACSALLKTPSEAHAALVVDSFQDKDAICAQTESTKKPARPKISSFKSGSAGKATVRVKAVSGADGYQYKIALNKKLTKAAKSKISSKASYTFSGLSKGNKYYAKVRAYRISNGKKAWGSWSAPKSVTVTSRKQPANGIYTVSLDIGDGTAKISGKTLTLKGGVKYVKKLDYIVYGPNKRIQKPVTFTLDRKTKYGIDNTDLGIMEYYSRSEFANMLAARNKRIPFVMVRVESGKVTFVGTLWV